MLRADRFILPIVLLFAVLASGQGPAVSPTENQAAATQNFDIGAAVNVYLAKMPPAQRARSDAYFEGGYWLILWDFLSTCS